MLPIQGCRANHRVTDAAKTPAAIVCIDAPRDGTLVQVIDATSGDPVPGAVIELDPIELEAGADGRR